MRTPLILSTCLLVASALMTQAASPAVDPAFVGSWAGTAEIVVNWTTQRTLRVDLTIAVDGSVIGTVGDASIVAGEFRRNRGFLGRALKLGTDYIITGGLEGPIIASEGIARDSFTMPLNRSEETLVGGVHAGRSKFGGRESMMLSATRMRLSRKSAETQDNAKKGAAHPFFVHHAP